MTGIGEFMRAVSMAKLGKARVLKYGRRPTPSISADEALVKVHALSVNARDLLYRSGRFIIHKPLPHILGADCVGEIALVGDGVRDWEVGERVAVCFEELGRARDGSYAEYCAVPAEQLARLPDALDYQEGAAAGASFADAWQALIVRGQLDESDRLVIYGGGSDLGIAALQIARAKGARQIIAVSSHQYAAQLRALGADIVLDDVGNDLTRQVKVATDEGGATLVLHCAEADKLPCSINMLAHKGRLALAAPAHNKDLRLNMMDIYLKNLSILGCYDSIPMADYAVILQAFARGVYRPIVDEILPLSQARKAQEKLEREPVFGKIILVPDSIMQASQKPSSWIPIE